MGYAHESRRWNGSRSGMLRHNANDMHNTLYRSIPKKKHMIRINRSQLRIRKLIIEAEAYISISWIISREISDNIRNTISDFFSLPPKDIIFHSAHLRINN